MLRHHEESTTSRALLLEGLPTRASEWLKIASLEAVGSDTTARCRTTANHPYEKGGHRGEALQKMLCIGLHRSKASPVFGAFKAL